MTITEKNKRYIGVMEMRMKQTDILYLIQQSKTIVISSRNNYRRMTIQLIGVHRMCKRGISGTEHKKTTQHNRQ